MTLFFLCIMAIEVTFPSWLHYLSSNPLNTCGPPFEAFKQIYHNQRPDHVFVSSTSRTPSNRILWLLDPIKILCCPFSHTHMCSSSSQSAVLNRSSEISTRRVSPGCKKNLEKAFELLHRSCDGRHLVGADVELHGLGSRQLPRVGHIQSN